MHSSRVAKCCGCRSPLNQIATTARGGALLVAWSLWFACVCLIPGCRRQNRERTIYAAGRTMRRVICKQSIHKLRSLSLGGRLGRAVLPGEQRAVWEYGCCCEVWPSWPERRAYIQANLAAWRGARRSWFRSRPLHAAPAEAKTCTPSCHHHNK